MLKRLTETIDSRPLGLARIVVGSAVVGRGLVAIPIMRNLADETLLTAPHLSWWPEPTIALISVIVVVWLISGICLTIGWHVSVFGPILVAAIASTIALDQQAYSNHLYLMAWLVLLLSVADAGAGMNISRSDRPVVRWPVVLLMLQLSIVYGFSALSKIHPDFLTGSVLAEVLQGGLVAFPDSLRTPQLLSGLALVVIAVELALALLIWAPRFRPLVFILGLGLHVSITLLMTGTLELAVFSVMMLALYPLFLDQRPLTVTTKDGSGWEERLTKYDLLRVLTFHAGDSDLALTHLRKSTEGADAHTRVLEHLVPWLWFAPLLRIPGISHAHRRLHRERSGGVPPGAAPTSSRALP